MKQLSNDKLIMKTVLPQIRTLTNGTSNQDGQLLRHLLERKDSIQASNQDEQKIQLIVPQITNYDTKNFKIEGFKKMPAENHIPKKKKIQKQKITTNYIQQQENKRQHQVFQMQTTTQVQIERVSNLDYLDDYLSEFESDTENADYNVLKNQNVMLKFQKEQNGRAQNSSKEDDQLVINLLDFLKQKIGLKKDGKKYKCIHCDKAFDKAAALGGHTSKNHPSKSRNYKKRIFSCNVRRVERTRSNFLKTLNQQLIYLRCLIMNKSPLVEATINLKSLELDTFPDEIFCISFFKIGYQWQQLEDKQSFQTPIIQRNSHSKRYYTDYSFTVNFSTKSIFGFPKGIFIVYENTQNYSEPRLIAYGVYNIPFQAIEIEDFEIPLFFPHSQSNIFYQETKIFENIDFLISSQNRYSIKTQSIGKAVLKMKISTENFEIYGVQTKQQNNQILNCKLLKNSFQIVHTLVRD